MRVAKSGALLLVIGVLFSNGLPRAEARSLPNRSVSGTYESPAPFYIKPEDCALPRGASCSVPD